MRKQAGPASIEVATQEKWDKVSNNKDALVIGYFRSVRVKPMLKIMRNLVTIHPATAICS